VGLSAEEIRPVIQAHLTRHANRCSEGKTSDCWDPIFVIKPSHRSRFKNLVDILDEMKINAAPKYALADFLPEDSAFLAQSIANRRLGVD